MRVSRTPTTSRRVTVSTPHTRSKSAPRRSSSDTSAQEFAGSSSSSSSRLELRRLSDDEILRLVEKQAREVESMGHRIKSTAIEAKMKHLEEKVKILETDKMIQNMSRGSASPAPGARALEGLLAQQIAMLNSSSVQTKVSQLESKLAALEAENEELAKMHRGREPQESMEKEDSLPSTHGIFEQVRKDIMMLEYLQLQRMIDFSHRSKLHLSCASARMHAQAEALRSHSPSQATRERTRGEMKNEKFANASLSLLNFKVSRPRLRLQRDGSVFLTTK